MRKFSFQFQFAREMIVGAGVSLATPLNQDYEDFSTWRCISFIAHFCMFQIAVKIPLWKEMEFDSSEQEELKQRILETTRRIRKALPTSVNIEEVEVLGTPEERAKFREHVRRLAQEEHDDER